MKKRQKAEGGGKKSEPSVAALRRKVWQLQRVKDCQGIALREAWDAVIAARAEFADVERLNGTLSMENTRLTNLVAEFKQAETDRAMRLIRNGSRL